MARLILLFVAFVLVSACAAKEVTLHGFVTAVHSSTSFEIDDYRITDDTASVSAEKQAKVPHLKPGELRVGLEVEVKGSYYPADREVMARAITALHDDEPIEGMGLVENKDKLQKNGQAWAGTLVTDGEVLTLTPETVVTQKRSRVERKAFPNANDLTNTPGPAQESITPDQIGPDTFAHYQGTRQVDGTILANKIEFQQDWVAKEDAWDWKDESAHVVYPDPKKEAGTLTIGERVYDLFPSPEAQEYLTELGRRLVPQHQRDLPDESPSKVQFRFFLIDTDTVAVGSYPNGIVVVSAHAFDDLDNEAQLAFILSHDIARAVEKQSWQAYHYQRSERVALRAATGAASAFTFGGPYIADAFFERNVMHNLQRQFDCQADRKGIEYMMAAGYDPREAPETWQAIARDRKEQGGHLFWGNRDHNLLRRSYLSAQLNLLYADKDFSTLKKDSPDFHAAVEAIRAARQRNKLKR